MKAPAKTATVYRMVMPDHTCPYGLKTIDLLKRQGFAVEDHHLTTREETDAFKAEHGIATTPQTFIDGQRIGGYDDLRTHFGKAPATRAALPADRSPHRHRQFTRREGDELPLPAARRTRCRR